MAEDDVPFSAFNVIITVFVAIGIFVLLFDPLGIFSPKKAPEPTTERKKEINPDQKFSK